VLKPLTVVSVYVTVVRGVALPTLLYEPVLELLRRMM